MSHSLFSRCLLALVTSAGLLTLPACLAQGMGRPDPQEMQQRLFQMLDLSAEQQAKVKALDEKYPDGMRNQEYRAAFETLLTPEQKQKLEELKNRRPR